MKIVKKQDITNLIESTLKEVGLLKEGENMSYMTYMDEEEMCEGEGCGDNLEENEEVCEECGMKDCQCNHVEEGESKPDFLDLDKDGDKEEPMKKAAKEKDSDMIEESIEKTFNDISKKETLNENLKKDLERFNNIMNYKQ